MTRVAADMVPAPARSGAAVITLKRRADFVRLSKGVRRSTPAFGIQAGPAAHGAGRFGFTVTKKVGTATERNRIRRRLKAAVKAALPDGLAFDVVVVGRRNCLSEPFDSLVQGLATQISAASRRLPPQITP